MRISFSLWPLRHRYLICRSAGCNAARLFYAAVTACTPCVQVRPSGCKDDLFGEEARARAKTEEGWNVYTEAELKLGGAGGGTDMCPFDCDCCF